MKHCSLFCAGWWPFFLLPLLLLLPLLYFNWDRIERDVAGNAAAQLGERQSWAQVNTFNRGRDVLLSGEAPNQTSVDTAVALARDGIGVRTVGFAGTVAPKVVALTPATASLALTDDNVILRGQVDSQATIDRLLRAVQSNFRGQKIVNQLTVGSNIAAMPDLRGLFAGIGTLGHDINLAVDGDSLILSGDVASEDLKQTIGAQAQQSFSGKVDNRLVVVVENNKCQDLLNDLLATAKINFQSGKAQVREDSTELLNSIASTAKLCPDASFEIAGHTDSTGSEEFNTILSQRRAQAVLDYLSKQGLDGQRFTAKGYGPTAPIASNGTRAGRATNRRIEFKIKNLSE